MHTKFYIRYGILLIWLFIKSSISLCAYIDDKSEVLHPNMPVDIYVCAGRSTTILIRGNEPISAIALSSSIVSYKYNKSLNELEITPTGRLSGLETNLNLRIGSEVYVLILKLVSDVRTQYVRVFTPESALSVSDEDSLIKSIPQKPAYVDLLGSISAIERMQGDEIYRKTKINIHEILVNDAYVWKNSILELVNFYQFIDQDLLIFIVRWTNRMGVPLYLDPRDLEIWVNEINIPIIAATRKSTRSQILPGETDTIYLAIQGYRLSRRNAFRLKVIESSP